MADVPCRKVSTLNLKCDKMIVFISNFLNHHQYPVAQRLYELTSGNYRFIETEEMPESFKRNGYDEYTNLPWLIQAWKSNSNIDNIILEADAVVFSSNIHIPSITKRLKLKKLTFEFGERWFKRGYTNIFSPRLIRSQINYHLYFRNAPFYRLNASAYAANDFKILHSFKNRMYKWGYFTANPEIDIDRVIDDHSNCIKPRIIAVARFIKWKHLELAVYAASNLQKKGYDFELNIYGSGPEKDNISALIKDMQVEKFVFLKGNRPNTEIIKEMQKHDIFIFTSDRNEGWGAVINEAMGNGCAIVGSSAVGSVPYLIKDGENGLIFKSGDINDLTQKIEMLLQSSDMCKQLSRNAYHTIQNLWSPNNAANNLLKLIEELKGNHRSTIKEGPCSPAMPL